MLTDLGRYLGLLRGKWPLVVPAALTAGLAIVTVLLGRAHPLALPAPLWLAITVLCLMVAQFLLWRDAETTPVEPSHAEQLRTIANRLQSGILGTGTEPDYTDGKSHAVILEEAFRAHFPDTAQLLDGWHSAIQHREGCEAALTKAIEDGASERFSADGGCDPTTIAWLCTNHLRYLLSEPERVEDYLSDGSIIGGGTAREKADARAWARDLFQADIANDFRVARDGAADPAASAVYALEPIAEGAPIDRERSCPVCVSA